MARRGVSVLLLLAAGTNRSLGATVEVGGASSDPRITFHNSSHAVLSSVEHDNAGLVLKTASAGGTLTPQLTINSAGNVAIGTPTPTPGVNLHIGDGVTCITGNCQAKVLLQTYNTADASVSMANGAGTVKYAVGYRSDTNGGGQFKINAASTLDGASHFVMSPTGHVALGTSPDATYRLKVTGPVDVSDSYLTISKSAAGAYDWRFLPSTVGDLDIQVTSSAHASPSSPASDFSTKLRLDHVGRITAPAGVLRVGTPTVGVSGGVFSGSVALTEVNTWHQLFRSYYTGSFMVHVVVRAGTDNSRTAAYSFTSVVNLAYGVAQVTKLGTDAEIDSALSGCSISYINNAGTYGTNQTLPHWVLAIKCTALSPNPSTAHYVVTGAVWHNAHL